VKEGIPCGRKVLGWEENVEEYVNTINNN